jgi:predicted branched-subunit amino acid permease
MTGTEPSPQGSAYWRGFRAAFGMPSLVLFASMTGFGSLAREASISLLPTIATTIGIWGLPGQMVMVEMVAFGAPLFAIGLAVAAANARFLPMTLAITPHLADWRTTWLNRLLFAQLITLTPWAMALQRWPAMTQEDRVPYFVGFSMMCMIGAVTGTVLGHELAAVLPRPLTLSLIFLSPAFFSMVFAGVRQRAGVLSLVCGAAMGPPMHMISPDWGLPVTGLVAGSVAFGVDLYLKARKS